MGPAIAAGVVMLIFAAAFKDDSKNVDGVPEEDVAKAAALEEGP